MMVAGPKQDVADKGLTVPGPKEAVAGKDENVAEEDELLATWRRLVVRNKNMKKTKLWQRKTSS